MAEARDAFNNNARGSWRVDLNFEASGGIEGGGAAAVTSADVAAAVAVAAMNPRTKAARRRAATNPRTAIEATGMRARIAKMVATTGATSEVL